MIFIYQIIWGQYFQSWYKELADYFCAIVEHFLLEIISGNYFCINML